MPQFQIQTIPYTIRPGDTLWLIAQRYNTTVYAIAALNPGIDLNSLYIGQVINVPQAVHSQHNQVSKAAADLKDSLRSLWEQHVFWTRLVILSIVFNLPDVDVVTKRLLQNPTDFEKALRPLYGERIASKFADLFKSHLAIAAELVKAAKSGNTKAANDIETRWYANADQIAAFLASINPYWSESTWKSLLHDHLAMTKAEAVNMLSGKYQDSIAVFDRIEQQALVMADVMTKGIVSQFPNVYRI
jgi:Tfp pilus assembly protein FimV